MSITLFFKDPETYPYEPISAMQEGEEFSLYFESTLHPAEYFEGEKPNVISCWFVLEGAQGADTSDLFFDNGNNRYSFDLLTNNGVWYGGADFGELIVADGAEQGEAIKATLHAGGKIGGFYGTWTETILGEIMIDIIDEFPNGQPVNIGNLNLNLNRGFSGKPGELYISQKPENHEDRLAFYPDTLQNHIDNGVASLIELDGENWLVPCITAGGIGGDNYVIDHDLYHELDNPRRLIVIADASTSEGDSLEIRYRIEDFDDFFSVDGRHLYLGQTGGVEILVIDGLNELGHLEKIDMIDFDIESNDPNAFRLLMQELSTRENQTFEDLIEEGVYNLEAMGVSGPAQLREEINGLYEFMDIDNYPYYIDEDGFVDEIINYQMWTASGGIDLKNRRGNTYSDETSRKWDAIKVEEVDSGFSVLVEGHRSKEGKFKVVSADQEGVIGRATRWLNGNQMFNEGYEDLFAMDFNGNSDIGI